MPDENDEDKLVSQFAGEAYAKFGHVISEYEVGRFCFEKFKALTAERDQLKQERDGLMERYRSACNNLMNAEEDLYHIKQEIDTLRAHSNTQAEQYQALVKSTGEKIDGLREALEWALKQLNNLVDVRDNGAFITGTNSELAGFECKFDKAQKALSNPTDFSPRKEGSA